MRKLKVDLNDLELALDTDDQFGIDVLDLETGEALGVDRESLEIEGKLYDQVHGADDEEVAFEQAVQEYDMGDWQKDAVRIAHRIESDFGRRYIRIEKDDPHADYQDMESFIDTVEDERLQDRLYRAISGRGAFRYFRDTLDENPATKERWYAFKNRRERERALEWLRENEIELIDD